MKPEGPRSAPPERHSGASGAREGGAWLVLGGGGLKGLAHIGAWRALAEAGVRPRGIVGTSIGALVGALIAGGMPAEEMRARGLALERTDVARVNRRAVWINGIRQPSVFQGETLRALFESLLPRGGWDALQIPLLVNAVDLVDGSTTWFGAGARTDVSLVDAVYASSALPVFYPPFVRDGHAYVDGGVMASLSLAKAADRGADNIIAIDVGAGGAADVKRILDGGMIAVHQRVIAIMMEDRRRDLVESWNGPPLVYVRPRVAGYGAFDFEHIPFFLDEGYRATREVLTNL